MKLPRSRPILTFLVGTFSILLAAYFLYGRLFDGDIRQYQISPDGRNIAEWREYHQSSATTTDVTTVELRLSLPCSEVEFEPLAVAEIGQRLSTAQANQKMRPPSPPLAGRMAPSLPTLTADKSAHCCRPIPGTARCRCHRRTSRVASWRQHLRPRWLPCGIESRVVHLLLVTLNESFTRGKKLYSGVPTTPWALLATARRPFA